MEPFAKVIHSEAILERNGGHGTVAVHTIVEDLYNRL